MTLHRRRSARAGGDVVVSDVEVAYVERSETGLPGDLAEGCVHRFGEANSYRSAAWAAFSEASSIFTVVRIDSLQ